MALSHGRNVGIYINGVDVSGDLNAINPNSEQELADVTTFGQLGHTLYPGLAKDTVSIEALYNSTERGVFEGMVQATPASTSYGVLLAYSQSVGAQAYCAYQVELKNNAVKSVVTDINRATINLETSQFPFESAILHTTGKQTFAAASSANIAILDNNNASGTTGGAGYLQCFSIGAASTGSWTASLYMSSTGAFAGEQVAIIAFTVSTTGTQRIAYTGQIYRYTLVGYTNNASTCEIAIALARY